MHHWVLSTKSLLSPLANDSNANAMRAYMRNQFEFLGIQSQARRAALKPLFSKEHLPPVEAIPRLVDDLWALPHREYQLVAIDLLIRLKHQLPASMSDDIERWITAKSWWDTVDMIATHSVASMVTRFPETLTPIIEHWQTSPNLWLRRTTLLYQLKYKHLTDEQRLFDQIRRQRDDSDFFIQKAIGWALREYSKTAPQAVTQFVNTENIQGLAKREALKWVNKRPIKA